MFTIVSIDILYHNYMDIRIQTKLGYVRLTMIKCTTV